MKNSCIDICGITSEDKLPKILKKHPFAEICETHNVHIPKGKPNIEKIVQLFIDTSVKKFKLINTSMGKKLIVEGVLHIKVFYVTDIYSQNIYFVYSDIPIYTFIRLNNSCKSIDDISVFIEDATIDKVDSKTISVSCLMFLCPAFKKEIEFDDTCKKDKKNQSKCDAKCNDKEDTININFEDSGNLECNIEYDMNSDNSYKNYCIDKKY